MFNHEFSSNPIDMQMQRSRFDFNSSLKTTFDQGQLVPLYTTEILPGDTFTMDTSVLCRMATPIYPVMDDAYLDMYWFFVPNRLVWDKWKNFLGENTNGPWAETVEYTIPQLKFDQSRAIGTDRTNFGAGNSLSNYLGVPAYLQYGDLSISDLPNRAYRLIYNEFFRDQNLQSPVPVYTDSSDRSFEVNGYGGEILRSCRLHDVFSSCLPSPQKGDPVNIALGSLAPVVTGQNHPSYLVADDYGLGTPKMRWSSSFDAVAPMTPLYLFDENFHIAEAHNIDATLAGPEYGAPKADNNAWNPLPSNLWADLSSVPGVSINSLREAFAIQRLLEKQARGGSRYREILLSMFGVSAPDASMQIPEYLGGNRININVDQVVQTSSTDSISPQGNTSGYSLTTSRDSAFTKSFTEHGILMCIGTVRVNHSYCQGVERWLMRKNRYDFYWPSLANLGEQAVMQSEIYTDGSNLSLMTPFGYNEAWYDYRYKPNRLNGKFVSDSDPLGPSSLGSAWTYVDRYDSAPTLGSQWIQEPNQNVQQTLAVQNEPHFIADFYFKAMVTRAMPLYSIPGLIDHY